MELNEIIKKITKDNIIVKKINLGQDLVWKGEYLFINKKHILFINSNIKDKNILKPLLSDVLDHLNSCTSNNNP